MYNAKSNKRNIHNILIVELLHDIFIGLLYHFISNILVVKRHYKIFCVNGKYGIQVRVSYFLFYTFAK